MRKLIVSEFLSLDGVMQAPGGPDEDRRDGFEHGGWQMGYFDEVTGRDIIEGIRSSGGMVLGRRTYEIFAAYWPHAPKDDPFSEPMNRLPKHVASRSLTEPLAWENSTLITGDVADGVRALKDEPGGDLIVIGSGDLVRTLTEHDVVDAYRLMVHPLLLGSGRRLFGETGRRVPLRLTDSRTTDRGVLILTYEPER